VSDDLSSVGTILFKFWAPTFFFLGVLICASQGDYGFAAGLGVLMAISWRIYRKSSPYHGLTASV